MRNGKLIIGELRTWINRPTVMELNKIYRKKIATSATTKDTVTIDAANTECLYLIGMVLVEAFTPSNVRSLPKQIEKLPGSTTMIQRTGSGEVLAGRVGIVKYERQLGMVSKNKDDPFRVIEYDPSLPAEFDIALTWQVDFIPSLTLILTGIAIDDDKSDLTKWIYGSSISESKTYRLVVEGRFGTLRGHIRWSRPKHFHHETAAEAISNIRQKRVQVITNENIFQAQSWFKRYFKGFLAGSKPGKSISIPLFATKSKEPFSRSEYGLPSGILDYDFGIWASTTPPGWLLNIDGHLLKTTGSPAIFAGRLGSLPTPTSKIKSECSNRVILQEFFDCNMDVFQWISVIKLLEIYTERLAKLRDGNHKLHFVQSRLFKYRRLRDFLESDALDIVSITNEIDRRANEPEFSKIDSPKYQNVETHDSSNPEAIRHLEQELAQRVRRSAAALAEDYKNVIDNLQSATQLRQSIANFRIQIWLVVITFSTLVITYLLWHKKGS